MEPVQGFRVLTSGFRMDGAILADERGGTGKGVSKREEFMTLKEERDFRRHQTIQRAVEAADRIILDGSDGSTEETNHLTAEVARCFVEKALTPFWAAIMRKDVSST